MVKKLTGLFFLILAFSVPITLFFNGGWKALWEVLSKGLSPETVLAEQFPGAGALRRMHVTLNYIGGNKEQNGVFIADDMLMLNVQPSGQDIIDSNITLVIELSLRFERSSYLMLIPTASAIQQSKVPYNNFAPTYDQRELIDEVYRRMAGNLTVIDVYPTLFNHQNEYLYYRTDNAPTGVGGYYIYTVAARKLGQPQIRGLEQFDVQHIDYHYYGDLYALSPFRAVTPDRISTYQFSQGLRGCTVTHYDKNGKPRQYFTLYPAFKQSLGNSMEVILGGVSPIVEIDLENAPDKRLLIFGDHTMQSYLPFLMVHYKHVTFVETAEVNPDLLSRINPGDYNQILFAYSVDRFVSGEQLAALGSFGIPSAVQKD